MFENGKSMPISEPFLLKELDKESEYDLSIVVPAYNEEQRLPLMMEETVEVSYCVQCDNPRSTCKSNLRKENC